MQQLLGYLHVNEKIIVWSLLHVTLILQTRSISDLDMSQYANNLTYVAW
jgi:hypothetical protein